MWKSDKLFSYLEKIHQKYKEISNLLGQPEIISNSEKYKQLSKELVNLKSLEENYHKYLILRKQRNDVMELYETAEDHDMKSLAQEESDIIEKKIIDLEKEIKIIMVTDESEDSRNVFLEIRAGAGGNESSLFASDLVRMYSKIAERKSWKSEIVSTNYSSIGGIKEIIIYIKGIQVYKYLKFESGVHRVQRVPITESSGRIHTSTVTIAVLPEVDEVEVDINPKDIRIDTFSASAPGGQHVNRTQSAIRITHFPSGIVASCQDEKSQHKNKERAMKVLKARLYELEKNKQHQNIANNRKSQIGSGDRSEKIRTYNFPQNRITDHRITGKNFNIDTIIDGNMDDLIKALTEYNNKKSLEDKIKEIIA